MTPARDLHIGSCRLILGDALAVLPTLGAQAALCLTDPPYPLTSGGARTGELGGCLGRAVYDNSGRLFETVPWEAMARPIFAALAPNANAVVMTNDRQMGAARAAFEAAEFGFHRLLVWNKGGATPNRYYRQTCEFALFLYKGRARTITNPGDSALMYVPHQDVSQHFAGSVGVAHPTEKPVTLMERWIENSTDSGGVVIDPFMGSGSTLVAAAQRGRRAIGIEKDPHWFEMACARVTAAVTQTQERLDFDRIPA